MFTIPALKDRVSMAEPDYDDSSGASFINGMAWATYNSLPEEEYTFNPRVKPSSSKLYVIPNPTWWTVVHGLSSPALQLPEFLLSMKWLMNRWPNRARRSNFLNEGIKTAYASAHRFIPQMIQTQFFPRRTNAEPFNDRTELVSIPNFDPSHHWVDAEANIILLFGQKLAGVIELKDSFSSANNCWNSFPFTPSYFNARPLNSINTVTQDILKQAICYLDRDKEFRKSRQDTVLIAFALPPTSLFYAVIDFSTLTVTVFSNILPERRSGVGFSGADLQGIVSPDAWRAYLEVVLWFHLVALAFAFPSTMDEALEANLSNDKQVSDNLRATLAKACDLLHAAQPMNRRVYHLLWCTRFIYWAMLSFTDVLIILRTILTWKILGTDCALRTSRCLTIPCAGDLDLWNESWYCHFPAVLPVSTGKSSDCWTKRFYSYPKLGLFIKTFSHHAYHQFQAEVKAFNHLLEIQGEGIPRLYASGKIAESEEFCLVMSYEGEPLEQWSQEDRCRVENLVVLLHKYNIHHHDIAPRNVVVDEGGKFTLIDFGNSLGQCDESDCTEDTDLGMGDELASMS